MYKDFYQLKTEPFKTHPDPGIIFISNTHKEAWYYLLYSMDTQEPYLVLTGEYGMGKTLLCLRLIQVLSKKGKTPVEYIATPNEGYGGILRRIASSLGISAMPEDVSILQSVIYDYFRTHDENTRFYLIIDDAQELDQETLTYLRQLSTFNHNGFFPVSIIFVAHPSFLEELKTPALSSLNQRIKRRYHLSRFNFDETKNYIYFRLLKSGATGIPAFSEESLHQIFTSSGGVPRLINNICDTCLLLGASEELTVISLPVVEQAVAMVEGSLAGTGSESDLVPETTAGEEEGTAIAELVPTGIDAAQQDSLLATQVESEEGQSEAVRDKAPGFGKRIAQIAMTTAAVLLLMSAGAVISQLFFKDARLPAVFSPGNWPEKHQVISQSPIPAQVGAQPVQAVPGNISGQPEGSNKEVPSPTNEKDPKAVVDAFPPAEQAGTVTPGAAAPLSTEISSTDSQLPQKTQALVPESTEPDFFPYSLRSSSYQHPHRAEQELVEIRQMGLTPYLVKVDLGDLGVWWRVYIGFYPTDNEAKKIKTLYNLSGVTVQKTEYACQLEGIVSETELMSMFDRLKQSDYFPYVIQKGKDRFQLYVGAYERKSEAEAEHKNLLKNGFRNQIVKR
jgi:type II secretory pathway predicted ATPase ExeA